LLRRDGAYRPRHPHSYTPDRQYQFEDLHRNFHSIVYVASTEATNFRRTVDELESMVNASNIREAQFQRFFETHPEFILDIDYRRAHPHVALTRADGSTLIPD
jgi:hypothetical protein